MASIVPMDFECYVYPSLDVGAPPADMLSLISIRGPEPSNTPWFYPKGEPKRVTPNREQWDSAVGMLLRLKMPKHDHEMKQRRTWINPEKMSSATLKELQDSYFLNIPPPLDPDELALLNKVAMSVARKFGMMSDGLHEFPGVYDKNHNEWLTAGPQSMLQWLRVADNIQQVFGARKHVLADIGIPLSELTVFLVKPKVGQMNVVIRPRSLSDALCYWATLMVGRGLEVQECLHCSAPIMAGGGRGRGRKRQGTLYCNTKCKNAYHNAQR